MVILLTMGTGKITVDGDDADDVTVARHVKSTTKYIHVNRIYQAIANLAESGEHAGWPSDLPPWLDDGAKNILSVLVFFFSGFDFLPGIVNCAFPAMWESLLRGLAIKGFFGDIVSRNRDGYVRINTNEAVKMIALTYLYRDRKAFTDAWDPSFKDELSGSVDKLVNVIGRQVLNLHGSKGNMLCPTRYSLWAWGVRADATLEYWQGTFAAKMPPIRFKDRDWDTDSGKGQITKSSVVVVLSEHYLIYAKGNTKKLTCGWNPEKAPERKCMGTCSCWRRGKRFVPPRHVGAKVAAVRVTATPEGSAPAAAAPHLNPYKINGVG